MPKTKSSRRVAVSKWIASVNDNYLTADGEIVFCKACDKQIKCDKKSQLRQHVHTAMHKSHVEECKKIASASTSHGGPQGEASSSRKNNFYMDMYQAMVAINMPWRCLNNKVCRDFLKKYTNQDIPDESTLRKNYLEDCYNLAIQKIRDNIGDNDVWISVDETTDSTGRYIANLVVGKLCETERTEPYLLASKQLPETNHATIARFVNSAMRILWPSGGEDKILLLVTDAAAYMLKAGKHLKVFYPNMLHITCMVHGFHRIAEEVRLQFPAVNKVISSVKKVFLKAPLRIEAYKNKLKDIPLPPEPIITRWGTWLEAAIFYATHIEQIRGVIEAFNENEASSIKSAKEALQCTHLQADLTFIKSNFHGLPEVIKKLESVSLPLTESAHLVETTMESLKNIRGNCGQKIAQKVESVLNRNTNFNTILGISKILMGERIEGPREIPAHHWCKFKYAPITSCDVERTFSAYKLILTEKRHQFTTDTIEKTIVTYCNLNYNK